MGAERMRSRRLTCEKAQGAGGGGANDLPCELPLEGEESRLLVKKGVLNRPAKHLQRGRTAKSAEGERVTGGGIRGEPTQTGGVAVRTRMPTS